VVLNGLLVLLAVTAVLAAVSIYQLIAGSDDDVVSQPPTATSTSTTGTTVATGPTSSAPSTSGASPTLRPPPLPAAAAKQTRDGAAAFVRYFFDVYNYSYEALDSAGLRHISGTGCRYCASVITDVEDAKASGDRYEDGLVSVEAAVTLPGDMSADVIVNAFVSQTSGAVYGRNGQVRETSDAVSPGKRVDALLQWTANRWIVRDIAVIEGTS
jgi:hypothetical protein